MRGFGSYKKDLLKCVSKDISQGFISESTFKDIINWKSPRVKGKMKKDFEYYDQAIKQVLLSPDHEKLQILIGLDGIGVPVASTILNFIYPDKFPIMDVRVTEALCEFKYLNVKARSLKNYSRYRKVILEIVRDSGCSMREVDRALFAYHKINDQKKKRKNTKRSHCCNSI
jgi:hypothetical protein